MAWSLYKEKTFLAPITYVYILNGVNNAIATYRNDIITDATTQDFTIELELAGSVGTDGVLFAKNLSNIDASKELECSLIAGIVNVIVGGVTTSTALSISSAGVYQFGFGSNLTIIKDSVTLYDSLLTRGVATEPTATMTVGAGHNGSLSSYTDYYDGVIANYKVDINGTGVVYNLPINDQSQFLKDLNGVEQPELWTYGDPIIADGTSSAFGTIAGSYSSIVPEHTYYIASLSWANVTGRLALLVGRGTLITPSNLINNSGHLVLIVNSEDSGRLVLQDSNSTGGTTGNINISVKKATEAEIIQYDANNWVNKDDL